MKLTLVGHTVPQSRAGGMGLGIAEYIYQLGRSLIELNNQVELYIRGDFNRENSY